jgi:hypothetical protein
MLASAGKELFIASRKDADAVELVRHVRIMR